jgi:hypothetical protein
MPALPQRAFCEWLGTAFLLAAVVGFGIMAQKLAMSTASGPDPQAQGYRHDRQSSCA